MIISPYAGGILVFICLPTPGKEESVGTPNVPSGDKVVYSSVNLDSTTFKLSDAPI